MNKKYTILVAEDEEYNFTLLKYILLKEGIDVLWARNWREAVDIVERETKIDLVLMDIKMPIMNGLDATIEIKKQRRELPVIAVTAYAQNDDREICLKAGCDDFITKPINHQYLIKSTFKLLQA